MAPGEVGISNILKMAREGLRQELTTALHKAAVTKEVVLCPGLRVKTNGSFTTVNLTICPVVPGPTMKADPSFSPNSGMLYLVILEEAPEALSRDPLVDRRDPSSEDEVRITALKEELRAKEEYLQSANEELETANEELKSSNEEMQSVNEELQSTNEELETAKEEMQSVNEELSTVNNELQTKVTDLSQVNNDMNNLLAGTGIATVFVDHQLRILRFTPTATKIINLIQSDVGRPVNHIVSNLVGYQHLSADTQAVLNTLVPKEIDVQTTAGAWYTLRIQPYRTLDNVIEGAVITFVDITEVKRTQAALRVNEEFLNNLLDNAPVSIYVIAADGTLLLVNKRWKVDAGKQNEQVIGQTLAQIFSARTAQMYAADNQKVLESGMTLAKEEEAEAPVEMHQFYTVKYPLHHIQGRPDAVGGISMDITERKQTEKALQKANELLRLAVVVRDAHDAITVQDLQGRILAWNPGAERIYGWSEAEALKMTIHDMTPEGLRAGALDVVKRLVKADVLQPYHMQRFTKDGRIVEVWLTATALVNESGQVYAIATTERERGLDKDV